MTRCGFRAAVFVAWATVSSGSRLAASADPGPPPAIDVVGAVPFPDQAIRADGSPLAVAGLSGLAWLGDRRWVAVMDVGRAFVEFSLEMGDDGVPRAIRDVRAVPLAVRHDYEDVALCPPGIAGRFAAGGRFLVCEEDTPAVHVVDATGAIRGRVPLPDILTTRRPNRGLESLCVAAGGTSLWTANEEALAGDGPPPGPDAGTLVRIVELPCADAADPRRGRQLAYRVDPPHVGVRVSAGEVYSGVVALVALPDGRLLVLERSAARCLPPFENRIYVVDPAAAADISGVAGNLAARPEAHLPKRLAWRGSLGCNLEGLAVGPPLASGTALVAVADAGGLGVPGQVVVLRMGPPVTSP